MLTFPLTIFSIFQSPTFISLYKESNNNNNNNNRKKRSERERTLKHIYVFM